MHKKTLCIILHYGSEEVTWNCVASLISEQNTDIVISDNDPAQCLLAPQQFETMVTIYKTGGEAGFAEGNNLPAAFFLSEEHDSVFILNNDTLVQSGALGRLRKTLEAPDIGAVGPCLPYAQNPKKIWACGGWINRRTLGVGGLRKCQSRKVFDVDYLPGAAMLCKAEIWQSLNGLPEKYFLAYEEAEFALEVRRLGYRVVVNPGAVILHYIGMTRQPKPMYFYNGIRNKLKFGKYLYGSWWGTLLGLMVTAYNVKAMSIDAVRLRFMLWWWAIRDEVTHVQLNRKRLLLVAQNAEKLIHHRNLESLKS
jgi:GT2 family glycosyltransferase